MKEVRSFLGFVNFYQHFMQDFSEIARTLNSLNCKAQKWSWGGLEQMAFEALKKAVTSAPTLVFASDTCHFCLECDASGFAIGGMLSQQQTDGQYHPVGFISKSLTNEECNYPIYDKELLAIICALDEWQHFLEGTVQPFDIYTDH